MAISLDYLTIESSTPASACVIWLHGLGANGHDFAPIVPQLGLQRQDIRFIFPHAPAIPVSLNFGYVMPAWFDISELSREKGSVDLVGLESASFGIQALIEQQEAQGIPSNKIALVGFSQGGALALVVGLRYSKPLAGIGALSTFLPDIKTHSLKLDEANQHTPILFCHGSEDEIIPLEYANHSVKDLRSLGYSVAWHEYEMPHTVCLQETQDIGAWLKQILA